MHFIYDPGQDAPMGLWCPPDQFYLLPCKAGTADCHIQEDKPNPIEPVAEKSIPILLRLFIFILTMNSPKLLLKL
jgi:hypothetical protein